MTLTKLASDAHRTHELVALQLYVSAHWQLANILQSHDVILGTQVLGKVPVNPVNNVRRTQF